jgi:hypothetical protein
MGRLESKKRRQYTKESLEIKKRTKGRENLKKTAISGQKTALFRGFSGSRLGGRGLGPETTS